MGDFISALTNPDIAFLRYALIAGLLASVPFGIMGSFVVSRRITYIAGAISHSVLAGIGAALFIRARYGCGWLDPIYGAIVAAIVSALIIGFVSMYARQREDTVIGAIWAVGMATGVLFIAKTPGYIDAMSYLFGNILMVGVEDIYVIAALDVLIVVVVVLFYGRFLAICFDEEFAKLRGINVHFWYLLLLCLTALTIVLLVRIVGIVMVIAFLTLPAAIAGHFSKSLSRMMVIAAVVCMVLTAIGLAASYSWDLPGGPAIIVLAGLCYIVVSLGRRRFPKLGKR